MVQIGETNIIDPDFLYLKLDNKNKVKKRRFEAVATFCNFHGFYKLKIDTELSFIDNDKVLCRLRK